MKTSYFYKLKHTPISGAVSIAVGKPRYVNINHELKSLAPTWELLNGYKKGTISEAEYIVQFSSILKKLNVKDVIKELHTIVDGEEPVLMCHCSPKNFCHRHLVAEWISQETGTLIEELGLGVASRVKGRLVR